MKNFRKMNYLLSN